MTTPPETADRIIHPVINEDGSVHYPSVMSPLSPDKRPAVCPMLADRIIPVIFVPGIMGSNLKKPKPSDEPVWRMNSEPGAVKDWVTKSAAKRKELLDPDLKKTEVDDRGDLPTDAPLSNEEMRRRGWGEVAAMSYGSFLVWLETHLNDIHAGTDYGRNGLRAELMDKAVTASLDLPYLTRDEVATSYRYQFPVHAVGYNWLQSNANSAERLKQRIEEFIQHYRNQGRRCEKVILVTHSMGGLVARYYSEVLQQSDTVLGIVHGVMPATGAATAYKRVKAGTEGGPGLVLGDDAAKVTAVFAQSPGALQLLPSNDYGKGWLKIRDYERVVSLPSVNGDPYNEIYLQRGKWWGLIDDRLLNPLDSKKQTVDQDWETFKDLINKHVEPFHSEISRKYHRNTYAFYGDDPELKAWGDVTWKRTVRQRLDGTMPNLVPYVSNLQGGQTMWDAGRGEQTVSVQNANTADSALFVLQEADEIGDGTVPHRSGAAPKGERGVQVCVPFSGCKHEGAYKDDPRPGLTNWAPQPDRRRFTLWAITKIAYEIRNTSLAYRT